MARLFLSKRPNDLSYLKKFFVGKVVVLGIITSRTTYYHIFNGISTITVFPVQIRPIAERPCFAEPFLPNNRLKAIMALFSFGQFGELLIG
jgi:hypothetical protein